MTIEEQAALYEAGVKTYMEGTSTDKDHLSRVLGDGMRDHMALEELFSADRDEADREALRKAYDNWLGKTTLFVYCTNDLHMFSDVSGDLGPGEMIRGYATQDAEWSMRIFENWARAKRLAAQRPLIHNGRKMKR